MSATNRPEQDSDGSWTWVDNEEDNFKKRAARRRSASSLPRDRLEVEEISPAEESDISILTDPEENADPVLVEKAEPLEPEASVQYIEEFPVSDFPGYQEVHVPTYAELRRPGESEISVIERETRAYLRSTYSSGCLMIAGILIAVYCQWGCDNNYESPVQEYYDDHSPRGARGQRVDIEHVADYDYEYSKHDKYKFKFDEYHPQRKNAKGDKRKYDKFDRDEYEAKPKKKKGDRYEKEKEKKEGKGKQKARDGERRKTENLKVRNRDDEHDEYLSKKEAYLKQKESKLKQKEFKLYAKQDSREKHDKKGKHDGKKKKLENEERLGKHRGNKENEKLRSDWEDEKHSNKEHAKHRNQDDKHRNREGDKNRGNKENNRDKQKPEKHKKKYKESFKNNHNDTSGEWFENMHKGRKEKRKLDEQSDWMFDRAQGRNKKRDKAHWYFDMMDEREVHRIKKPIL